jgi:hypothetical protein
MPLTGPPPVAPTAASSVPIPVETAAREAVISGTQTPRAQTIAGTIQAAAQTTPGALTTTAAQNGAFAGINGMTTGSPETTALSWLVTFWFQGLKASPKINQNQAKWFLLPLLAILIGFFVWWAVSPDHNPLMALGKAVQNAGLMAANAIANYKTTRPLGWFEPAQDVI